MCRVKKVQTKPIKVVKIKKYAAGNRIGQLKQSITNVLGMLFTAEVMEEYKPELKMIKEQINKTKLL